MSDLFFDIKNKIKEKKITKISLSEKKKLVEKVKTFSKVVHMEIFYFLKKRTKEEFTINQNGVFINLNNIDNETLFYLREMVNFYKKNEKTLQDSYLKRYHNQIDTPPLDQK